MVKEAVLKEVLQDKHQLKHHFPETKTLLHQVCTLYLTYKLYIFVQNVCCILCYLLSGCSTLYYILYILSGVLYKYYLHVYSLWSLLFISVYSTVHSIYFYILSKFFMVLYINILFDLTYISLYYLPLKVHLYSLWSSIYFYILFGQCYIYFFIFCNPLYISLVVNCHLTLQHF